MVLTTRKTRTTRARKAPLFLLQPVATSHRPPRKEDTHTHLDIKILQPTHECLPYSPTHSRMPTHSCLPYSPTHTRMPTHKCLPYSPTHSRMPTQGCLPYSPTHSRIPHQGQRKTHFKAALVATAVEDIQSNCVS